jgi:hypothetical protein
MVSGDQGSVGTPFPFVPLCIALHPRSKWLGAARLCEKPE